MKSLWNLFKGSERKVRKHYRPVLERLEERAVPATYYWRPTDGTNWNTAANWDDGGGGHAVPGGERLRRVRQ